ncbi:MAG: hypothetical protein A2Y81_00825 [Nitrospirae bacterium RBG_13_43_8]|nr:MAG: hypothetical protein A2Y81_00825 [Nitrospirae bacterium RBG_13_43_8]
MKSDSKKVKEKKAYEKPRLRTIELAAEEVLAVGCKIAPGAPSNGISGGTCTDGLCISTPGS